MIEYQAIKKTDKIKEKESSKITKVQNKTSEQKAIACPNCNASIPEDALFCAECGFDLNHPLFCPNCGAKTSSGADICQVCKAWLLEGKCKFCYAELSPESVFCHECGNPKVGLSCPNCGKLSIFDFCSYCGKPLTENAIKTLELTNDDPDVKEMIAAIELTASINSELAELEAQIETEFDIKSIDTPVRKSFLSDSLVSAIIKTGENREASVQRRINDEKTAEEKAKKAKEEEKIKQEKQRLAKIKANQARKETLEKQREQEIAAFKDKLKKQAAKRFATHQEARRWHMSNRHQDAKGWLCNYTGTVHLYPEGPNDCGEPALGGCDYFDEIIQVSDGRWVPRIK